MAMMNFVAFVVDEIDDWLEWWSYIELRIDQRVDDESGGK
jgi:hypothetical protein